MTQHQPRVMALISTGNIFILCSSLTQCAPFKEQPKEERITATAATYNRSFVYSPPTCGNRKHLFLFSYYFLVSKKVQLFKFHKKGKKKKKAALRGKCICCKTTGPLHSYEKGESVNTPKPAFFTFKSCSLSAVVCLSF